MCIFFYNNNIGAPVISFPFTFNHNLHNPELFWWMRLLKKKLLCIVTTPTTSDNKWNVVTVQTGITVGVVVYCPLTEHERTKRVHNPLQKCSFHVDDGSLILSPFKLSIGTRKITKSFRLFVTQTKYYSVICDVFHLAESRARLNL